MASVPIYTPQAAPDLTPLPQQDASAYGAAVASGIGDVGDAIDHVQKASQATTYAVQDAQRQTQISQAYLDLQGQPRPGGAGFADDLGQKIDQINSGVMFPKDPELRQRAIVQQAQDKQRMLTQALGWQAEQQGKAIADNTQTAIDTSANDGHDNAPTDATGFLTWANSAVSKVDTMTGAMRGVHPDAAAELQREGAATVVTSGVRGLLAKAEAGDAQALATARTVLANGSFGSVLKPGVVDQLSTSLEATQTRLVAQAKAAAEQARAQALKNLGAQELQLNESRGSPDAWFQLQAGYTAANDPTAAARAHDQAMQIVATEGHRGDTQVERQTAIDVLSAKPELTPDEGATLKGLKGQQTYLNGLPALSRYTYSTGNAVAPLNWQDPTSIQQRAATVSAAQGKFGGDPAFLLPGEEQPLKQLLASSSRSDKIQAMNSIIQAGQYSGKVLDQVAPNDHEIRSTIALAALPQGQDLMDLALRGQDALRASPGMLDPQKNAQGQAKDGAGKPLPTFDQIYTGLTAQASALLPPPYRAAMIDNARNVYAARAGQSGYTALQPGGVQSAVSDTIGGQGSGAGQTGGVGSWRGQTVFLPRGMLQSEFEQRLSRSGGALWAAANTRPDDPPIAAGGRVMHAGELRGLIPTMVGNGVYALRQGDNTYISTRSGQRYEFNIGRLSSALPPSPPAAPSINPAWGFGAAPH